MDSCLFYTIFCVLVPPTKNIPASRFAARASMRFFFCYPSNSPANSPPQTAPTLAPRKPSTSINPGKHRNE
jgi:hypothetical protein